jgi:hypothetical protein
MNDLAMVHFKVKRWWAFRSGSAASRASGEIAASRLTLPKVPVAVISDPIVARM